MYTVAQRARRGSCTRANASKLYLLTTEVKNQRKISISRLIYFHRFKAIA
ncbi:RNA:NAD 2'-phosphotransferase [Nostoc flagelliforme CCNUN1]|uniref:RNA:NAD 2'-phosphotransferase n=1 Tax=Nostoc flagelliforme CCNUN1 TaxID=2038116 RepID=A0A2K8SGG1_9NOSO|nr:RNA:NAD 2'-phosphotransferase [Nostoc flagelliforme CCNUN1]